MSESQLKSHFIFIEAELQSMNSIEKQQMAEALKASKFLVDSTGKLQFPASVYQVELQNVIGYLHPTCNFSAIGIKQNRALDKIMHFYKDAPVENVIINWKKLIADESKIFDSKCLQIGEMIRYLQSQNLQSVVKLVSKFLKNTDSLPANDVQQFCRSSVLCLSDFAPVYNGYFYRLNAHLRLNSTVTSFLKTCGIAESFGDNDYVNFLNGLHQVESDMQMNQILIMLQHLGKNAAVKKLPDTTMVMRAVTDLCLNDFELSSNSMESSLILCHEDLPHKLCKEFGVKTKRSKLQEINSVSGFEPFFQREDISRRLARIAESYSDPMDIFKELIQNADDAGASEIHFILDEREHQKKAVIDDGWDRLLDPGLLVFNDTFFKSSDVVGIQDVGLGSKTDEADKIGQFGVGFNCVYSLTDYPSILTQIDGKGLGDLLMFDPLRKICKEGGARIKLSHRYVESVPDSFRGYLGEVSDLDATKGRTMFRFPLRKQKSKLGVSAPLDRTFVQNLEKLANKIPQFLLFLTKIRKILVSKIDTSGNFINISSHFKKIYSLDGQTFDSFTKPSTSESSTVRKLNLTYSIDIFDNLTDTELVVSSWKISQQNGSECPVPDLLANRRASTMIKIKQSAAVALPINSSTSGLPFRTSITPGVWCFLPLEEISAQMRGGAAEQFDVLSGSAKISLPVAINAHFLLDESRKMLSLANKEPRGAWNAHALEHLVAPAYACLIMELVNQWENSKATFNLSHFEKLFPRSHGTSTTNTDATTIQFWVVKGLVRELKGKRWLPVLTFKSQLINFWSETQVKNFVRPYSDNGRNQAIFEVSTKLGFKLTQISAEIRNLVVENGLQLCNLQPSDLVTQLYKQKFDVTPIEQSIFKSVKNLAVFLDWCSKSIVGFKSRKELPIYLTANNHLQKATAVTLYSSSLNVCSIFPQLHHQIMHPDIEWRLTELPNITKIMNVEEFISHLKTFLPQLCDGQTIPISSAENDVTCSWVQATWDFLAFHSKEVLNNLEQNKLDNFSILLCRDKNDNSYLKPISCGENEVFVDFPILKIGSVTIHLSEFMGFFKLHSCLKEEQLPRASLATKFVLSENLTVDQQINVVYKIKDDLASVHETHKVQLYEHFKNSFINDEKSISQLSFNKLREVPIFRIIPNNFENLLGVMAVYSVPCALPQAGLSLTKTLADKYVLEEEHQNGREFQKRIGIVAKTVEQLYVETLVPLMFSRFEWEDLSHHLEFLSTHLRNLSEKKPLLMCLQDCSFIEDLNGEKHKASYFYDPHCALFSIFKNEQLLLEKYWNFSSLFKQFGLNNQVSVDDFWNFITLYSANEVAKDVRIFEHFLIAFRTLKLSSSQFGKIGTLPIFLTSTNEHRKLNDVFLHRDKALVEFVAPVLSPSYNHLLTAKYDGQHVSFWDMWCQEGNTSKPSPDLVIDNIEQILTRKNPKLDHDIQKCLNYVVEASNDASVDRVVLQKLSKVACVRTANGALVPARQICLVFKCPLHYSDDKNAKTKLFCDLKAYVYEPSETFLKSWKQLEILGATKMISLQQSVFALEQLYNNSVGSVWAGNPNLKGMKYDNLYLHFMQLATDSLSEVAQLSEDCPLYLKTLDENLHSTKECVIIDDDTLFDTINKTADVSDQSRLEILPASQILQPYDSLVEIMKRLPLGLRPRFLRDIFQCEIDDKTFKADNLTAESFQVKQIESKLADQEFLSKIVYVISNKRRIISRRYEAFMTREKEGVDEVVLNKLRNFNFIPVKTVFYRYILDVNGSKIHGVFEKSFEYTEKFDRPTFVFQYNESFDEGAKTDLQIDLVTEMFLRLNCEQDSKVIEMIARILFMNSDDDSGDENQLFWKYGVRPFNLPKTLRNENEELIGSIVPFAFHALIDRDPKRKFREGEIVVIESMGEGNDSVYTYGMFVSTKLVTNEDANSNRASLLMIRTSQFSSSSTEKSSEVVFGLKEKVETENKNGNDQLLTEQEFERDLEELNQLIWVAVTSQKAGDTLEINMNKLESRLMHSILQKYPDIDKQQILTRTIKESIKTQMEAKRNELIRNEGDTSQQIPDIQSDCDAVEEFILRNFERMNLEIETHQQQLAQVHSNPRSSANSNISELLSGQSRTSSINALALHRQIMQQPQPHPPLARLWLRQAQEHVEMLNSWLADQEVLSTCYNWTLDISLKVLENSLATLILMQDGSTAIPRGHGGMSPTKTTLETLATLRSKTVHFNDVLEEVEDTLIKLKSQNELHRPDQGQMMTSGPQIDAEILQECLFGAMKIFELAKDSVPTR